MHVLFTSYHTILSRNGLKWFLEDNQTVAIQHVLLAIRPQLLQYRLTSLLKFCKYELRKDFHGFLAQTIQLAAACQIVDVGPSTKRGTADCGGVTGRYGDRSGGRGSNYCGQSCGIDGGSQGGRDNDDKTEDIPLCLWEPHRLKGTHHILRDCRQFPPHERKELFTWLA